MKVAVAGGTGLLGRFVTQALQARGHEVAVLVRTKGVDLSTGAGLSKALIGCAVVIDASNITTNRRRAAVAFFEAGTRNLLKAGAAEGILHHVAVSIVGIDRVNLGYYQAKLRQEALLTDSSAPVSILRATQFHEFAGQLLRRSPGPLAVVPQMRIQPVAAREVADALVDLGFDVPVGMAPELAGPDVHELPDLARAQLRAQHSRRRVVPLRIPGATGRAMTGGALLPTGPGPRGVQTFEQWLTATYSSSS